MESGESGESGERERSNRALFGSGTDGTSDREKKEERRSSSVFGTLQIYWHFQERLWSVLPSISLSLSTVCNRPPLSLLSPLPFAISFLLSSSLFLSPSSFRSSLTPVAFTAHSQAAARLKDCKHGEWRKPTSTWSAADRGQARHVKPIHT